MTHGNSEDSRRKYRLACFVPVFLFLTDVVFCSQEALTFASLTNEGNVGGTIECVQVLACLELGSTCSGQTERRFFLFALTPAKRLQLCHKRVRLQVEIRATTNSWIRPCPGQWD